MAKYKSGGWFKQSTRHSRARKLGHAGGVYSSERINKIMKKHPEYKNLNYKQLKNKGVFLKYQSDADKDGVVNIHDCKPLNSKKQDDNVKLERIKGTELYKEAEPKPSFKEKAKTFAKKEAKAIKTFAEKEAPKIKAFAKKELHEAEELAKRTKEKIAMRYKEYETKKHEAISRAIDRATQGRLTQQEKQEKMIEIQATQPTPEMSMEADDYEGEIPVNQIFTSLKPEEAQRVAERTAEAITRVEHGKIDDLTKVDTGELSDDELKTIAIRLGTGFFGTGNKYENELKTRIRRREKIETNLKIELMKAQTEAQKRIKEEIYAEKGEEKGGYI
jgi:hypothetical protein